MPFVNVACSDVGRSQNEPAKQDDPICFERPPVSVWLFTEELGRNVTFISSTGIHNVMVRNLACVLSEQVLFEPYRVVKIVIGILKSRRGGQPTLDSQY